MIAHPTAIDGALLVEPEPIHDERGFFARTYCRTELRRAGVELEIAQSSVSFNAVAYTLRGLHFQAHPHEEAKLIRCTRGRVFDVLVDVRTSSPTFRSVVTQVLSADEHTAIFAPPGVAHGFLTLVDETELLYDISTEHEPAAARGIRWDDPGLQIAWPASPRVLSERDRSFPNHSWSLSSSA